MDTDGWSDVVGCTQRVTKPALAKSGQTQTLNKSYYAPSPTRQTSVPGTWGKPIIKPAATTAGYQSSVWERPARDQRSSFHMEQLAQDLPPASKPVPTPKPMSAHDAAIPENTHDKLLRAARDVYWEGLSMKAAAKKHRVTLQALKFFWDTNEGEIMTRNESKSRNKGNDNVKRGGVPFGSDDDDDDDWR